ncbi:BY-kinase domain containing protein [Candidatus Nanopelagicaceae bacterium]
MVEPSPLNLVTAIADSESENFVASTLFTQGWSVTFRALDFDSLHSYSQSKECQGSVLVISTDLLGIEPGRLEAISPHFSKVFLFAASGSEDFSDAIALPENALDLVGLLRGSLRAPMTHSLSKSDPPRRARVIAIGSAGNATGCSTLALNIAAELSLLEKSVLLIDGNSDSPAIATLLGSRGLHTDTKPRAINQWLEIAEISHENVYSSIQTLEKAMRDRDFIVVDLGAIRDLSANLSGKRWTAEALVWVCTHGDDLWILAKSDAIGLERLRTFTAEISRTAIRPALTYFQAERPSGRNGSQSRSEFHEVITSQSQGRKLAIIEEYLFDQRSAKASSTAQLPLFEVNERSPLRKSIANLAARLIG